MIQPYFELLGRKRPYYRQFSELIEHWSEDVSRAAGSPRSDTRSLSIKSRLFYPECIHLGFGAIAMDVVRTQVEVGLNLTVEYFTGIWWHADELQKAADPSLSEADLQWLIEKTSRSLDRQRADRKLRWYEALTSGLFLGGLIAKWDDLARICSWFDATIEPEYQAGEIEDEYMCAGSA